MLKVIKPAGERASDSKALSWHGSKYTKDLSKMGGNAMKQDAKPTGFLGGRRKP